MDVRTYYGEYSLSYWIHLMLTENIILPDYQRLFVWNFDQVQKFIKSLKDGQYVQPVTIGLELHEHTKKNYIIDGQQRLTSILLAYLGMFPNIKNFQVRPVTLAGSNISVDDSEDENEIIEWKYSALLSDVNGEHLTKRDAIRVYALTENTCYADAEFGVSEDFFDNTFLGFSYIVPESENEAEQRGFYAKVFRNINYEGTHLKGVESRKALYYSRKDFENLFEPSFCKSINVGAEYMDFTRYLSLLAQYKKDGNADKIARKYKNRLEDYYVDFIMSMISGEQEADEKFGGFFEAFGVDDSDEGLKKVLERVDSISQMITDLNFNTKFNSIIEMDVYLIGLIYNVLFLDKNPDVSRKDDLIRDIEAKIAEFQNEAAHKKSPGSLGNLRNRIASSIAIFQNYV